MTVAKIVCDGNVIPNGKDEKRRGNKMIINAKFENGILIPKTTLDLKEGEVVEIVIKPQIERWVWVLKYLKSKSSVDLQHEIKDIWGKEYVPD